MKQSDRRQKMKRIVIDVDNTLTMGDNKDYSKVSPNMAVIKKLAEYKEAGFQVVLATARNMRTHENSLGKIVAKTVPILAAWCEQHGIEYDELWVGKPWCGTEGFYVDDRAIRPDEFVSCDLSAIRSLIGDGDTGN